MVQTLEDVQTISVDKWGSLNTAASPQKLPEGQSPDNQNVWMDEKPGSLVTANGYIKLGDNPSGNPTTFLIDYFKTSDGSQTVVLSDGEIVWKTTDYTNFTVIKTGLSAFFQLRGMVIRGKLWLTNGSDPVMTYDGTTLTVLDGSGGTPNVPIGKYIAYHDERVWIYGINGDPSSLRFADLADSSGTEITPDNANAWPVDNEIQISEGDDDIGTGLFLYRGYLYASKSYSIWRVVGYDEYTYTRVKTKSSTGTRFQESVGIVDNLVHFIGVDGLYTFDGEESKRISDIIDPSSSEEGVFAFRNLQQPLLNNQFWNVSQTSDIAAGTVPANLDTSNDQLTLIPADDSQADFSAGTLSDVTATDNPGYLQLALITSGGVENVALGITPSITPGGGGGGIIYGNAADLTDGGTVTPAGLYSGAADNLENTFEIDLGSTITVGKVTTKGLKAFRNDSPTFVNSVAIDVNTASSGGSWTQVASTSIPAAVSGQTHPFAVGTGYLITFGDVDFTFSSTQARRVRLRVNSNRNYVSLTELEVYKAGYKATGTFTSKSIDFGSAPASYGELAASIVTNSETYQFYTQSSDDGSTWDAAVAVSNGAAIGSTLRRYLRWQVVLNSSTGLNSPVIDKVFVGGTYLSVIHDTGGSIFQWGAFQLVQNKLGQTINAYYRAAATSGGVSAASWVAIVPGAIPGTAVANSFIQIRLEFSTADATYEPYVSSFTVNWVLGGASGVNTLQNVAAIVWLNRYWLSAATLGADANDIVLVKGKATFGSPWHKKDFAILSFCRFQDYFIAGSSTDGAIYRMEYGYSKNGSAMDSYFETGDFTRPGAFQMKLLEIVVNADRMGPYTVSIGISTDGGITWTDRTVDLTLATPTTNVGFTKKLNVNFMQDKIRLRVRNNASDQPFSVDSLDLFFRVLPFRGSIN